MKLATFGSEKAESDKLLNSYKSSNTAFIGYTDKGHEGTFTTMEGERLQFRLNFHTNEPNNYGGLEDCLEIKNSYEGIKYNDVGCYLNKPIICEFETQTIRLPEAE